MANIIFSKKSDFDKYLILRENGNNNEMLLICAINAYHKNFISKKIIILQDLTNYYFIDFPGTKNFIKNEEFLKNKENLENFANEKNKEKSDKEKKIEDLDTKIKCSKDLEGIYNLEKFLKKENEEFETIMEFYNYIKKVINREKVKEFDIFKFIKKTSCEEYKSYYHLMDYYDFPLKLRKTFENFFPENSKKKNCDKIIDYFEKKKTFITKNKNYFSFTNFLNKKIFGDMFNQIFEFKNNREKEINYNFYKFGTYNSYKNFDNNDFNYINALDYYFDKNNHVGKFHGFLKLMEIVVEEKNSRFLNFIKAVLIENPNVIFKNEKEKRKYNKLKKKILEKDEYIKESLNLKNKIKNENSEIKKKLIFNYLKSSSNYNPFAYYYIITKYPHIKTDIPNYFILNQIKTTKYIESLNFFKKEKIETSEINQIFYLYFFDNYDIDNFSYFSNFENINLKYDKKTYYKIYYLKKIFQRYQYFIDFKTNLKKSEDIKAIVYLAYQGVLKKIHQLKGILSKVDFGNIDYNENEKYFEYFENEDEEEGNGNEENKNLEDFNKKIDIDIDQKQFDEGFDKNINKLVKKLKSTKTKIIEEEENESKKENIKKNEKIKIKKKYKNLEIFLDWKGFINMDFQCLGKLIEKLDQKFFIKNKIFEIKKKDGIFIMEKLALKKHCDFCFYFLIENDFWNNDLFEKFKDMQNDKFLNYSNLPILLWSLLKMNLRKGLRNVKEWFNFF